jgi:hypothetical protein
MSVSGPLVEDGDDLGQVSHTSKTTFQLFQTFVTPEMTFYFVAGLSRSKSSGSITQPPEDSLQILSRAVVAYHFCQVRVKTPPSGQERVKHLLKVRKGLNTSFRSGKG